MHDVLAHRISQVSMHAGALAFREDLTPEEVRASASVIREKAHEALTDLRGVLGVLRGADGEPALAPQPTYADLAELVAEARESGLNVEFHDRVSAPSEVPDAAGRTLYRIVQEGITNARKHAPGSAAHRGAHRLARGRARRGDAEPARLRQRDTRAPGWGWSGSPSGPSCAAAGSTYAARASRFVLHGVDPVGGMTSVDPGRSSSTTTRWSVPRSR